MITKTDDIKLPPLPVGFFKHHIAGFDGPVYAEMQMEAYARAAVEANRREYWDTLKLARAIVNAHRKDNPPEDSIEADRRGRMPSDEELLKWAGEEQFFLFCDEDEFLQIAREVLSRYGSSQPAASAMPSQINDAMVDAYLKAQADVIRKVDDMWGNGGRAASYLHPVRESCRAGLQAALGVAAPVAQEPVAYLACDPETSEPVWGEDCVCKDNVYSPEDTGTIGRPVVFAPVAVQPVVTDEMVTRFLGWHLPQDFAPDAGISFNPSPDPHSWPVGTNLLTDPQARAMLEYVLQGAPAAAQAHPCAMERYRNSDIEQEEASAVERLRFFCSLAMSGQDWLDVEPLFDAVTAAQAQLQNERQNIHEIIPDRPSAQDREDAERYRWLRDRNDWHAEPNLDEEDGTIWKLTFYTPAPIIDPSDDDNLDTALIAAMLADAAHAAKEADHD